MTSAAVPDASKIQTCYSGRAEQIYMDICYTLSERIDQVDWAAYTAKDWSVLARMAKAEGVAPLMYWKLKDYKAADNQYDVPGLEVPPEIFHLLKTSYYNTLAQNTLMYQELERILRAFEDAGIPVIVLKGAALAVTVYEDIGLRPMGDLDLLIHPEDFSKAIRRMRSLGFSLEKITYHAVFKGGSGKQFPIEIHWSIVPIKGEQSSSTEWFWRDLDDYKSSTGYLNKCIMRPAVQLLYFVSHLMIDDGGQGRILAFFDLTNLISGKFDQKVWIEVEKQAAVLNWSPIIESVLSDTYSRFDLQNSELVAEHNTDQSVWDVKPTRTWHSWDAMKKLSWQSRWLLIYYLVIPSIDYMRWRYKPVPDWIWPLYYPVRWITLIRNII